MKIVYIRVEEGKYFIWASIASIISSFQILTPVNLIIFLQILQKKEGFFFE
jgi:hypothetical protein